MKRNYLNHPRPIHVAKPARFSQRELVHRLAAAILLGFSMLNAFAQTHRPAFPLVGSKLNPGDIISADSGNAIDGGFIIKVDPNTAEQTVVSSGGLLSLPFDPTIDPAGAIIVSDTSGRLIRVDPASGQQFLLADNAVGSLGMPCGIALTRQGEVFVANTRAVLDIDLASGQIRTLSSGGNLLCPLGIALADNGGLFVLNRAFPNQIVRVNPQTGAQKVISQGRYLKSPQAIAVAGAALYVTDVATSDGNFGVGRVIEVDIHTGLQTVVSEGGYLVGPVGIAVDDNGQLIVGDPYIINPESPDLYDGGIVRIDPGTGDQTLVVRGQGSHVNPRGVAIVPSYQSARTTVSGRK